MKKIIRIILIVLFTVFIISCNDNNDYNNDNNQTIEDKTIYEMHFENDEISIIVGEKADYHLVTNIEDLSLIDLEILDSKIASIEENKIVGKRAGETYLRAFYQNLEASVKIQVNMPVVYTVYEKEYWINYFNFMFIN